MVALLLALIPNVCVLLLQRLVHLRVVILRGCGLSSDSLSFLCDSKSLEEVDMSGTAFLVGVVR